MKDSRFTTPTYEMVALDDVAFDLLKINHRMQKRANGGTAVVISAKEMRDVLVKHDGMEAVVGFLTVHMVWAGDGKSMCAARIRTATMRDCTEEPEEVGMQFVQDLQDFIDLYEDKPLEQVLTENFVQI